MTFRKILFWTHLTSGLIAGVFIGLMCFTGAVLSFDKQVVAWAERDARTVAPQADTARLPLAALQQRVHAAFPDARPTAVTVDADPAAAVAFALGRADAIYVNPYTGEARRPASTATHGFMRQVELWHRWLALGGDGRAVGKIINGAANCAFLFLALTGLYLWLPRTWSWRGIRAAAVFNWRLAGKARDFNWHNSTGLWCAPVLIVLTLTAVPMSFRWGNHLLYALAGESAPAPSGPPRPAPAGDAISPPSARAQPLAADALLAAAKAAAPGWTRLTMSLPRAAGGPADPALPPVSITAKTSGNWPRTAATTFKLDPFTGVVLHREAFADLSPGRRLRTWSRFLHTGEALGWIGQFVAGLACLGGCVLVYTGFALAWRRFFRPSVKAAD